MIATGTGAGAGREVEEESGAERAGTRPDDPPDHPPAANPSWRSRRPSRVAIAALVIGLIVTAGLALVSLAVYNRNERRLLGLRVRQASLVLAATEPSIQTPLASAAELAVATGGSPQKFRAFMAPYVGPGRQFTSVSLWPEGVTRPAPTAVVGAQPLLASIPQRAQRLFGRFTQVEELSLIGLLAAPRPALGFYISAGRGHGFAVYAEKPLPANRRSRLEGDTAFSDLDYALYLGRSERTSDMLVTSVRRLPIGGRRAAAVVPFGADVFTIVVSPHGSLGGAFFESLPWIIAIVGVLVTLAAAVMTDRLVRRRRRAEELAGILDRIAGENRQMYAEQRSISQTLQHALLPDTLPTFAGLEVSACYIPAAAGVDVGGDWYDVIEAGNSRALLVIGDISGHGLRAATTMASLRHATLAYAAEDCRPAAVLDRLSAFVNAKPHDYLATVLCALIDADAHRMTVASAGHLPPLLLNGADGRYVELDSGVALGVRSDARYREASASVPASSTLVAFTDGLVERRGEVLDVGLARLRDAAVGQGLPLRELVAKLAHELTSEHHQDDTAIVAVQWRS